MSGIITKKILPIGFMMASATFALPINFVGNPSFEENLVGSSNWQIFTSINVWGLNTLPGNVELQGNGVYGSLQSNNPNPNNQAWDGHQWAELDYNYLQLNGPGSAAPQIYQDISGLTSGQDYVLSFYWAPRPTILGSVSQGTQQLAVYWGQSTSVTEVFQTQATHFDQNINWTNYTTTLRATSSTMRLGFGSLQNLVLIMPGTGTISDAGGNLLDMVSLITADAGTTSTGTTSTGTTSTGTTSTSTGTTSTGTTSTSTGTTSTGTTSTSTGTTSTGTTSGTPSTTSTTGVSVVPEPGTYFLFASGLAALIAASRKPKA